jgi:hypothetical protein
VKISSINLIFCAAAALTLAGCASYPASGSAPATVSGTARSQSEGEFYKTETLTPGVGSALFPDPTGR